MCVCSVPKTVPKLRRMGFAVLVESGAGESAGYADADFTRWGAEVVATKQQTIQRADIVIKVPTDTHKQTRHTTQHSNGCVVCVQVGQPTADEVQQMGSPENGQKVSEVPATGRRPPPSIHPSIHPLVDVCVCVQVLVCMLSAARNGDLLQSLASRQITSLAVDEVPRTTAAQSMDVRSALSSLAGYRAVLEGFSALGALSGTSTFAVGRVDMAKVLVIGTGVAGLQAISTAKRTHTHQTSVPCRSSFLCVCVCDSFVNKQCFRLTCMRLTSAPTPRSRSSRSAASSSTQLPSPPHRQPPQREWRHRLATQLRPQRSWRGRRRRCSSVCCRRWIWSSARPPGRTAPHSYSTQHWSVSHMHVTTSKDRGAGGLRYVM